MSSLKVEINEKLFLKMIESVKHCVAQTDNRIALMYIKLTVVKDKVTALACDSYRAAKTTITLPQPSAADFECYIKPIKIKPISKKAVNNVVIELENNIATVEAITEYGKIKYCFKQCVDKFVDLEKIYIDAHTLVDRKIGFNPLYVKQAVNALSQASSNQRKCVILETQEKNTNAFLLSIKDDALVSEQLVLPIKIER